MGGRKKGRSWERKMTEEGKSILFGIHVSGSVGWDVSIAKRPVSVQLDG